MPMPTVVDKGSSSSTTTTRTCLFCNQVCDRKSSINQQGSSYPPGQAASSSVITDENNLQRSFDKFKESLDTFWKLSTSTSISGNGRGGSVYVGNVSKQMATSLSELIPPPSGPGSIDRLAHPCCEDCYSELVELRDVQKVIEDAKKLRKQKLSNLINNLASGIDNFTCLESRWIPVRALLSCGILNWNQEEDVDVAVTAVKTKTTTKESSSVDDNHERSPAPPKTAAAESHQPSNEQADDVAPHLPSIDEQQKKPETVTVTVDDDFISSLIFGVAAEEPQGGDNYSNASVGAPVFEEAPPSTVMIASSSSEAQATSAADANEASSSSSSVGGNAILVEPRPQQQSGDKNLRRSKRIRTPSKRLSSGSSSTDGSYICSSSSSPQAGPSSGKRPRRATAVKASTSWKRPERADLTSRIMEVEMDGLICFCDGCNVGLQNVEFYMCTECLEYDDRREVGYDLCISCYERGDFHNEFNHEFIPVRHSDKKKK